MDPIDGFLKRHKVDVGRSLGALGIVWALFSGYLVFSSIAAGTPRVSLGGGGPVTIVVSIGLWRHRLWARDLSLTLFWLTVIATLLTPAAVYAGFHLNLSVLGTVVKDAPISRFLLAAAIQLVPCILVLGVLHSAKACEEFRVNESPEMLSGGTKA